MLSVYITSSAVEAGSDPGRKSPRLSAISSACKHTIMLQMSVAGLDQTILLLPHGLLIVLMPQIFAQMVLAGKHGAN